MKRSLLILSVLTLPFPGLATMPLNNNKLDKTESDISRHISPQAPSGHVPSLQLSQQHKAARQSPAIQLFPVRSAEMNKPSSSLIALANKLKAISSPQTVIITGHTDSSGEQALNIALSVRRAQRVQSYLAGEAPQHHYIVTGNGDSTPVADNNFKEGRDKNRRVTALIQGA